MKQRRKGKKKHRETDARGFHQIYADFNGIYIHPGKSIYILYRVSLFPFVHLAFARLTAVAAADVTRTAAGFVDAPGLGLHALDVSRYMLKREDG